MIRIYKYKIMKRPIILYKRVTAVSSLFNFVALLLMNRFYFFYVFILKDFLNDEDWQRNASVSELS